MSGNRIGTVDVWSDEESVNNYGEYEVTIFEEAEDISAPRPARHQGLLGRRQKNVE